MQQQTATLPKEEPSVYSKAYAFFFGATPVPPEIRMKEIEQSNILLRQGAERDYEDKKWSVEQSTKRLNAASLKGNEESVRAAAIEHVSLVKQQRQARALLNEVETAMNRMSVIRIRGATEKNLLEYMQCNNELMAKTANPMMVKRTTARFLAQKEALSMCNEMVDEALESSEDEEATREANAEVEALVQKSMTSSAMNLLSKMPTITINTTHPNAALNNNTTNRSPSTVASEIDQYTSKRG